MGKTDYLSQLEDYYGVKSPIPKDRTKNEAKASFTPKRERPSNFAQFCESFCSWVWGPAVGLVLIILSSILVIALKDLHTYVANNTQRIAGFDQVIDRIKEQIQESINPRIRLINTMVSYTLPSQINQMRVELLEEMSRRPGAVFEYKNNTCPKIPHPVHSSYFSEFDQDVITRCVTRGMKVQLKGPLKVKEMPSFIPMQTTPRACIRSPSFSLSTTIWAYSHTTYRVLCREQGMADQYFAVGIVSDSDKGFPHLEPLATWYLNDEVNRRHCSVAAGRFGAWMGCTITDQSGQSESTALGVSPISLVYLDIYGRKRTWVYSPSQIPLNSNFSFIRFSTGSGIVVGDKVYMLMYGGMLDNPSLNCFCYAPQCNTNPVDTATCNSACRTVYYSNRILVTMILRFTNDPLVRPILEFFILNPSSIWAGSEGRLFYNYKLDIAYIYTKSSYWHALPQVGLINLNDLRQIVWVRHLGVARPGDSPCDASNRCPKSCVTGVYTDLYPLGRYYEFAVTVHLKDDTRNINPTINILNTSRHVTEEKLLEQDQKAELTTTTCFVFRDKPWCIGISELSPSAIGEYVIVPFTFYLPLQCVSPYATRTTEVVDDRERVMLNVPSREDSKGQEVTLPALKDQWGTLSAKLPDLVYPPNYIGDGIDLFQYDVMVNPRAMIENNILDPRGTGYQGTIPPSTDGSSGDQANLRAARNIPDVHVDSVVESDISATPVFAPQISNSDISGTSELKNTGISDDEDDDLVISGYFNVTGDN